MKYVLMFELIFKNYKNTKLYELINRFYSSPLYVAIVALIAVASNIFGLEGTALILYVFISGIIPFLYTDNLNSLIAPLFMGYITVSKINNFSDTGASLLAVPGFIQLCVVSGVILGLIIIARIVLNIFVVKKKFPFPSFLISIFLFGLASILGGIDTQFYAKDTFIFGLMVGLFMLVPYITLFFIVDFKRIKEDYWAFMLLAFAIAILLEEVNMLFPAIMDVSTPGEIKEICRTGWGICNNIGAELVISFGGSAYLAIKKKGGFFYMLVLMVSFVGVILTCSRASMLFGALILAICFILIFAKANKARRIEALITVIVFLIAVGYLCYVKRNTFKRVFDEIIDSLTKGSIDTISSGRLTIYEFGFNQFVNFPLFGVGYFKLDIFHSSYFNTRIIPDRYHNTFIQIVACTGSFGLITYLIHRYSTLKHLVKHYNIEKLFIFIAIMGLLSTSLLDCHLFNLGPTMEYSVLLLLLEADTIRNKELKIS